ncbi:hypothetical protein VTO73DRAFT_9659 [Trametes versicolor]
MPKGAPSLHLPAFAMLTEIPPRLPPSSTTPSIARRWTIPLASTSMKEADGKPDVQEDAEDTKPDVRGGEEEEGDDEEEEEDDDDGILEVHG